MKKLIGLVIVCGLVVSCSLFGGDKGSLSKNYDKKINELSVSLKQIDSQIHELSIKRERIVGAINTLNILKQELK